MRVAVMATCLGDAMFPEAPRATVRLLRRLGVDVEVPGAQTCCGQPMVNSGYLDEAVPAVRRFVEAFDGFDVVVVPSGSCAGSVRHQHALVARRSGDRGLAEAVGRTAPRGPLAPALTLERGRCSATRTSAADGSARSSPSRCGR